MAKGGKQPGAGRPAGKKNAETILRDEALAAFRQRVREATDSLQNAQIGLAKGSQYLFKVITIKGQKTDPILVKDPEEIMAYLRGDFERDEDDKKPQTVYYFMTVKDPDNRALESLFNRTYGKATENVDLNIGGNLKTIIINNPVPKK